MAKKGEPKTPGSGRKRGTPNRATTAVQDRLAALQVDPIEVLALFAKGDWKALGYSKERGGPFGSLTIPPSLRAKCANDLAEFVAPKLKSIELKPSEPQQSRVVFETEWRTIEGGDTDEGAKALPANGGADASAPEPAPVQRDPVRTTER